MRNRLSIFITLLLPVITMMAQAPQGLNYQAVARNSSGAVLANQAVGIELTIISGTPTGTTAYEETNTATTNEFGLFSVVIGSGTPVTSTLAGVNWGAGPMYLQVALDPTGGTNYTNYGTPTQLQSVPYALNAASSSQWYSSGNTITNANASGYVNVASSLAYPLNIASTSEYNYTAYSTLGTTYRGYVGVYNDTAGFDVGTGSGNTAGTFNLVTDAIPRVTITPDGEVGIGTASPSAQLDVERTDGLTQVLHLTATTDPLIVVSERSVNKFYLQSYGGVTYFYNYGDSDMSFGVGTSSEMMHFRESNHSVGIGTALATQKLTVGGDVMIANPTNSSNLWLSIGTDSAQIGSLSVGLQINATSAATVGLFFDEGSDYIEPQHSNATELGSSGDLWKAVYATNGTIQTSDARKKKNIQDLNMGLKEVMALRPVTYEWINPAEGDDGKIGFIAQEVEKVVPQAVVHDYITDKQIEVLKARNKPVPEIRDPYAMNYSEMIPVLTKAIQEQQAMIIQLQKEVELLKSAK